MRARRGARGAVLAWAFSTLFGCPTRAFAQPIPGAPEESPPASTSAAFGRGLTLRTNDDVALLNLRLRTQFQGFMVSAADGSSERDHVGFLVRRLRLVFQGHVFDKNVRYYVQFGFAPNDQEPDLLVPVRDAQMIWTAARDVNIRVGQMKVPFSRERVISSSSLGMVDRSNINAELSLDRDIGVMLQSRDLFGLRNLLRYSLGVFGGDGRNRTIPNTGLLYAARIEVAPFGNFDDYVEVDFERSWRPRMSIGFAAAYSDSTPRARATTGAVFEAGTVDYRHGAADVLLKIGGFSLQTELLFRKSAQTILSRTEDDGSVITERPRSAWGAMSQLGFLVDGHWEPSLRYAEVRPFDRSNPDLVRDRELGGGLSYYFHKHDLKVQLDYFRLLADVDNDGGGVLTRDRIRLQSQFYF